MDPTPHLRSYVPPNTRGLSIERGGLSCFPWRCVPEMPFDKTRAGPEALAPDAMMT